MRLVAQERKSSTAEELGRKLDLIVKRLDTLEAIVLENPEYAELAALLRLTKASVGLYADPLRMLSESKPDEHYIKRKPARVQANLVLKAKDANVGEDITLEIELVNTGKTSASLIKVEEILPAGFDLVAKPDYCHFENTYLDMNRKRLNPSMTEKIRLILRSFNKGKFAVKPKIFYLDETGQQMFCKPESVTINILETLLPGRISTGYKDFDNLLLGGIPNNYAVILTSPSCDERDLLIKRFLGAGAKERQITFYVTTKVIPVETLTKEPQSNIFFVCNPQADKVIKDMPNVFKLKGVENLTDINIALTSAFRRLNMLVSSPRRACIEIISDVLLQHHPFILGDG